ncbi:hypothetical protein ACFCZ3_19840 [Cellulosimicrobium cellulans]|uniref:hypothetical protein n=1 Tax=Cellulosimicrobium cellulans TaxID=1710 RepID=UPI0035DB005E
MKRGSGRRHNNRYRGQPHKVWNAERHTGTCPVTGLRAYATKQAAKEVRRMTGSSDTPFWCTSCGQYHLGDLAGRTRSELRADLAGLPSRVEAVLGPDALRTT